MMWKSTFKVLLLESCTIRLSLCVSNQEIHLICWSGNTLELPNSRTLALCHSATLELSHSLLPCLEWQGSGWYHSQITNTQFLHAWGRLSMILSFSIPPLDTVSTYTERHKPTSFLNFWQTFTIQCNLLEFLRILASRDVTEEFHPCDMFVGTGDASFI